MFSHNKILKSLIVPRSLDCTDNCFYNSDQDVVGSDLSIRMIMMTPGLIDKLAIYKTLSYCHVPLNSFFPCP